MISSPSELPGIAAAHMLLLWILLGADEMALDLRMDIPEGATFMAIGLMARPHCSAESRITAAKTLRCILLCPSSDRGARGEQLAVWGRSSLAEGRGDGADSRLRLGKRSVVGVEEMEGMASRLDFEKLAQDDDGGSSGSGRSSLVGSHQKVKESRQRARNSIPGKYDNSNRDAAMMGGVHSESKVADLRMWLAGAPSPKGASGVKSASSILDTLPYALPIVAACLLVLVIIAVRVLKKTQPQSTSYINAALNNVKGGFAGGKVGRRY